MKIKNSKILKVINKGIILGLVVTILSFLISLVPCIKEAGFGVCRLPSPFSDLTILTQKYYGISNNPLTGLILQFLIPFILVVLILSQSKKKSERIIDYTKK